MIPLLKKKFMSTLAQNARNTNRLWKPKFGSLDTSVYEINCYDFKYDMDQIKQQYEQMMKKNGLVILRNTKIKEPQDISNYFNLTGLTPFLYEGGTTPRNKILDNVYDTGVPNEMVLTPHVEMSLNPIYPEKIMLTCMKSLRGKGETGFTNNVELTKRLLQTRFGKKLKDTGVQFLRHFQNKEDDSVPADHKHTVWQDSLELYSKKEVEDYLKLQPGYEARWDSRDNLYVIYSADGYEYDERLDTNLLMAHIANHGLYFDFFDEFSHLPDQDRPYHMRYGDESEMSLEDILDFYKALEDITYPVYWNDGDICIADNFMWPHSKNAVVLNEGEKREMAVMLLGKRKKGGEKPGKWMI